MPTIRLLFIISYFLLLLPQAQAQKAVSAGGGNATGTGGSMSFTIGQPDYDMGIAAAGSMAQGVQHPFSTATPTAPIVGPTHLCEGMEVTYTDSTPHGIWVSSNSAVASIGSSTGILKSLSGGVTIISYYVPGSGSIAVFTHVNVDTLPRTGPISGPPAVCEAAGVILTNYPADGIWTVSNPAVLGIDSFSGAVTGLLAGSAVVSYIASNACGYDTATRMMTVNPLPVAGTLSGPPSICQSAGAALAATVSGGTWSSSQPTIAQVSGAGYATGLSGGSALISYTVTNICGSISATHSITVKPLIPDAGIITGPNNVVTGGSIELVNAIPGGTWAASNTNASVSATGVVTGIATGTVTISYTVTTECGTNYSVKEISVSLPLGPITGNLGICRGNTSLLSNTVAGGSWFTSNLSVASVGSSSGIVTGISDGTATITYILSSNYVTATVTVATEPAAITGGSTVCAGDSLQLSSETTGGAWATSVPATGTINAATGMLAGITAGTMLVSYTKGCTVTRALTVLPLPVAGTISGSGPLCIGSTRGLSSSAPGGAWSSSNPYAATVSTFGLVTGSGAGSATISYTVTNGCGSVSAVSTIVVDTPYAGAITGPAYVAAGTTIELSAAITGGSWSSSATSKATVGSASGIVSGLLPGTTNISYTLSNYCGTVSSVKVISVLHGLGAPIGGTPSVCTGKTTTLTNPVTGGTWSSENTLVATISAGGIVNGIAAGTAVISYTRASTLSMVVVTVHPVPDAITGPAAICVAASAELGGNSGGTWATNNAGRATITPATGVVTGVSDGPLVVSYTSPPGCLRTYSMTVNKLPTDISGTAAFCVNASASLNSTGSPAGTWSSGNTSVATVPTMPGTVTGIAAGTSVITFRITSTGCYTTRTITVNPLPSEFTGPANVCIGLPTTYSSAPSGGTWSASTAGGAITINSVTGTVTGNFVSTAPAITYSVNGCSRTKAVTVSAVPGTISGVTTLCTGNNTTLAATGGIAWTSGNTSIATVGTTGIVTGTGAGTATISYANAGGCYSTKVVTVSAPPVITGVDAVCIGGSVSMSAVSPGTWGSSGPATITSTGTAAGISTCAATGTGVGVVTFTFSINATCAGTKQLTVNPVPSAPIDGTPAICKGSSYLFSHPDAGGTWASSAPAKATVSPTGLVQGVETGNAVITYHTAPGCFRTAAVTISAMPSSISGAAQVCEGATTAAFTVSGATGGSWSADGVFASIGSASGIVTGIAPGIATVSYVVGGGCYSTKQVTVNASPAAITGVSDICVGLSTSFSSATGGGTWTSSNPGAAYINATSGLLNTYGAGGITATITYMANGCARTHVLSLNALPTGSIDGGGTSFCAGTTTTVAALTAGLTWSSNNMAAATIMPVSATVALVHGNAAGTAVISYTNANGCAITKVLTVTAAVAAITGNDEVCIGGSTLLANADAGGSWSRSPASVATISAGLLTGVLAGTVNVTYSLGPSCFATKVVTVVTSPSAPITGPAALCIGSDVSFSHPTPGGTWTLSSTLYATIDSATGLASGVSGGTSTLTYYTGPGCFVTKTVTVYPPVMPVSGTYTVCQGAVTTLSSADPGGTWSTSDASVATIGAVSGTLTGITDGTAVITYTHPTNGCYSFKEVTVAPLPAAISGSNAVCVNSATTFSSSPAGGTWTTSAGIYATVGASTGVVTGVAAAAANITYTRTNGCVAVKSITVDPLTGNITGPATVNELGNVTLGNVTTGGQWTSSDPSKATIGLATGVVTGVATGNTTISYTITATGCYRARVMTVNPFGTRAAAAPTDAASAAAHPGTRVYPSPTSGVVTIEANTTGTLTVLALDGKELQRYELSQQVSSITLPRQLAAGAYICRYSGNDGTVEYAKIVYLP